jgi:hypothetical protein
VLYTPILYNSFQEPHRLSIDYILQVVDRNVFAINKPNVNYYRTFILVTNAQKGSHSGFLQPVHRNAIPFLFD